MRLKRIVQNNGEKEALTLASAQAHVTEIDEARNKISRRLDEIAKEQETIKSSMGKAVLGNQPRQNFHQQLRALEEEYKELVSADTELQPQSWDAQQDLVFARLLDAIDQYTALAPKVNQAVFEMAGAVHDLSKIYARFVQVRREYERVYATILTQNYPTPELDEPVVNVNVARMDQFLREFSDMLGAFDLIGNKSGLHKQLLMTSKSIQQERRDANN